MKRFWKLQDTDNEGAFVYVDHSKILLIYRNDEKIPTIEGSDFCWSVTESDFAKLLAWVETESEDIPTVFQSAQGYQYGSWNEQTSG